MMTLYNTKVGINAWTKETQKGYDKRDTMCNVEMNIKVKSSNCFVYPFMFIEESGLRRFCSMRATSCNINCKITKEKSFFLFD